MRKLKSKTSRRGVKRMHATARTSAQGWKQLPFRDRLAQVMKLQSAGQSNRAVARTLGIDEGSVRRLRDFRHTF
jgi:DNA-binding NarL/FixJ family response regulator